MNSTTNSSPADPALVDRYLPSNYPVAKPNFFGLPSIKAILWRQRYILIGVLVLALAAGLVLTMLASPRYEAVTTLRVNPNAGQLVQGQELVDPYVSANEFQRYVETLATVIRSRQLALRVVDDLDLTRDEAFMGEAIAAGRPSGVSEENWRESLRQIAADRIRGGLSVEIPLGTQILEIHYKSTDPNMATRFANAYAENFFMNDVARAAEANSYALQYLQEQIAEVRQNLQEAEVQVIDYARANRIIGQPVTSGGEDGEGNTGTANTLGVQSLSDVNQRYTQARANRIAAEARWRIIENTAAAMIPEVRDNSAIQSLRSQAAVVESQLADLRQRYQDDYPDVREKLAELDALNRQVASASAEIKAGLRNDYRIALREEEGLSSELSRISGQTLDEQDRRVQYNLIDRDVGAMRDQLATLLRRYNEVSSAANLRSSDVTMLDRATVPRAPFSPNLTNNLIIALILGLGLAGAIAVLREALDDRIHSSDGIEDALGVAALGQTPYVPEGDIAEALESNFSPLSEAYSSVRATLDYSMGSQSNQVIQITSGEAGEGKTTTSIALAKKYALAGKKALLVDFDLRRPALASRLGMTKPSVGVVDVLFSRSSLSSALAPNQIENLDILPISEIPANPVEILSSGLVAEFLKGARAQYDVIILDSSPIMGIADSPLLSRFVDSTVLVVEANRAHHGQLRRAIRRLRDMDAKIVGALLTKFRPLNAGEGYGYGDNYYYISND